VTAAKISLGLARTPDDIAEVKALFLEYAASLDFDLCFQGFDQEMATFPGSYAEPDGALVLARVNGLVAGAVGLRPSGHDPATGRLCEMKRLYVRNDFRGLGLGRSLAEAIISAGSRCGYAAIRLDTVKTMKEAAALYRSLGFSAIESYNDSPLDKTEFYQLTLP
jgi:ribosomal protein S18 acetylase RimI-like enzyme